jgi:dephospho-CoA kinase
MLLIGITGGIGTGKTTVSSIFSTLGIPVIYADKVAKLLYETDKELQQQIIECFGKSSFNNGVFNKSFISSIVFNSPLELNKLNSLVHPKVEQFIEKEKERYKLETYIIKESALLLETGNYKKCDYVIGVICNEDTRRRRVMLRDKISDADMTQRINAQLPEQDKLPFYNYIITNNEGEMLIPQVIAIHNKILQINNT